MLEMFAMDWLIVCYDLMMTRDVCWHFIEYKWRERPEQTIFLFFLFLFFFQKPYTVDVMNTYNVFSRDLHSHLKNDMSVSRDNFMLLP